MLRQGVVGRNLRRIISPLAIGLISVASAVALKLFLQHVFHFETRFLLLFAPIIVSATLGGTYAGAWATVFATFALGYFFIEHKYRFDEPGKLVRLAIFAVEASLILPLYHATKRLKQRLIHVEQESEARFQRLADCNVVGIAFSNAAGEIVDANQAFLELIGRSRQALSDRQLRWNDVLADDQQPFEASARNVNDRGTFEPVEREIIRPDGRRLSAMIGGAVMDAASGQIGCFVLDITRIKEAEAMLRGHRDELENTVRQRTAELSAANAAVTTTNELLRAVIEGINDPVFVKGLNGDYRMINRAGANVLGKPFEQIIGKNDCELFNAESGQQMMDLDRRIMETGEEATFDQELPTALGLRTFLTTKVPHRNHEGQIIGLIGIARDITERKSVERAAQEANAAKDHFLAILSHELRTPLMPVLATASTLENDQQCAPRIREDAALIRRNIETEARLIDDLLDVTRIAKGKLELYPETLDLQKVLEDVVQVCRGEIESRQLRLVVSLHASHRHVRGDPVRLHQIFWNLLRNAAKFTPAGGQITLECADADDADFIEVSVSDTGIGIGVQTMQRIFNAFEQGNTGITRRFGGLGLGLTLSKALAEAHRGTLRARSDGPGRGSVFTVTLPTCAAPTELTITTPAPSDSLINLRVLIVDDHVDTARTLMRVLQLLGCKPVVANSVAQGRKILSQTEIDMVLSDIHLQDGSGLDLAPSFKEKKLPAVAISGSGMPQDVRESLNAGFVEHLVKPVRFDQIEAVLRKVAASRQPLVAGNA
jgi:PAS domain S-box-containing protein